MRADEVGMRPACIVRILLAILVTLAVGDRALGDEPFAAADASAEVVAKAEVSASDLAASLRSLESSLRTAAPVAENSRVLSAEENDALVEAGVKQELAALAVELDRLSAALALGVNPDGERVLLNRVGRHAAALSQLGARPARPSIPPELHAELLALWSDVEALSAKRTSAPASASDPPIEAAP